MDGKLPVALTLALLLGLGQSSTDIFLSSLQVIGKDFGVSPAICNLLISAFALGLAFGCLTCGFLSDRFGRRRCLLAGATLYALSSFGVALSPDIMVSVVLRFVQAYSAAFPIIVSRQYITDVCDKEEQVRFTAFMLIGLTLSPAVAPLLGAYIANYASWRMDFVFSGIAALLLLGALFKVMPETLKAPRPIPSAKAVLKEYSDCFKSREFNGFTLIIMLSYGAFFGFISMCSYMYMRKLGYSAHAFSLLYMSLAVAYLGGNRLLTLLQRGGGRTLAKLALIGLMIGIAGSLLNFISFIEMGHPFLMGLIVAVGVGLMRGGYAVMQPPAQVLVLNAGAGRPGVVMGLIFFLQFVAGAVVSSIAACFHMYPLHGTVSILAILMLLCVPAYLMGVKGEEKA